VIRRVGIIWLAANGATKAVLWLSPAMAGDQTLPGATVESVVAIAKRLNPTVVPASLEVELQKYAEMERLAGGSL
jgi:outer membrane protein, heavy metal efflux system